MIKDKLNKNIKVKKVYEIIDVYVDKTKNIRGKRSEMRILDDWYGSNSELEICDFPNMYQEEYRKEVKNSNEKY